MEFFCKNTNYAIADICFVINLFQAQFLFSGVDAVVTKSVAPFF